MMFNYCDRGAIYTLIYFLGIYEDGFLNMNSIDLFSID